MHVLGPESPVPSHFSRVTVLKKIYSININNPASLIAANNFYILPNDIVFIPQTKLVKWNNVISLLTPSETLFKTYKPYIAEQDDWYIISDNEDIVSDNR